MPSLEELKELAQKGYAEAKAKEEARKTNPALAATPEGRKHYRGAGGVLLVLGLAITIANYLGYQATGRVFIFFAVANLVLIFAGLYMLVTGKNPFARLKR